jgi:hypothetical protein
MRCTTNQATNPMQLLLVARCAATVAHNNQGAHLSNMKLSYEPFPAVDSPIEG